MELTHFDEHGNARMVDVSEKDVTSRSACAVGSILVNEEILHKIEQSDMKCIRCSSYCRNYGCKKDE